MKKKRLSNCIKYFCMTIGIVSLPLTAQAQQPQNGAEIAEYNSFQEILRKAKPAPMPHPSEEVQGVLDNSITEYNPETGETLDIPATEELDSSVMSVPPDYGTLPMDNVGGAPEGSDDGDSYPAITPTPPSPRSNTTSYPWNTTVKLLMRFGSYYYVCSGATIRSFMVYTAGHCIYNHDPNDDGNTSDAQWADEVWIWPGQTDRVYIDGAADYPYGVAKMTLLRTYNGWINSQNFNYDFAWITLDRRLGDRVGWMGRETNVTASSLNFNGYPTETPYVPAGTHFQYPGYDSGNVDSYTTYRIIMDAYTYGGHSGGPVWRYISSSGDRYIQGVNSTSNRTGYAGATRITNDTFNYTDTFIAEDEANRPPTARPELIEYTISTTAKDLLDNSVAQGGTIDVEYNVYNIGWQSTSVTVDFYLSTNNIISSSDYAIGSRTFTLSSNTYVDPTATLTVSSSVPTGTYYVGWLMSSSGTEYTPDNNSAVIGAEKLTVTASSSPGTLQLSSSAYSVTEDGRQAAITVQRLNGSDGAVSVEYATSNDTATAGSDYTDTSGRLNWSDGNTTNKTFRVPIIDDSVPESNETLIVSLDNATGGAVLGSPDTAVLTIMDDDQNAFSCNQVTGISKKECQALIALYESTDGDNWADNSGWNVTNTPCNWHGVTCKKGSVEKLELSSNKLKGSISAKFFKLKKLEKLDLSYNEIDASIFKKMKKFKNLKTLLLNNCKLSGKIPNSLMKLKKLTELDLNDNCLKTKVSKKLKKWLDALNPGWDQTQTGCSSCTPGTDTDNDRLDDCYETNTGVYKSPKDTGTDPNNQDTDGDAINDGDEVLGTLAGLDLPAMGVSPVHKNILIEYDWFDDKLECSAHSHRPTDTSLAMVTSAFNNSPVTNPDGTTGITIIHDYGQGGVFKGGNLVADADGVLTGGVNDSEFKNHKKANFDPKRQGYFHYTLLPHRYNTNSGSSGQAELPGNDLIVSLYCAGNDKNVSHTIMHELGHNLYLRHGGFENTNYKPNYNSVMNYKYQFPGVDKNCTPPGDGILDYSIGDRINLDETALDENEGTCGSPAWDWNGNGTIESSVAYDINNADGFYSLLKDSDDWSNIVYTGLNDSDGKVMLNNVLTDVEIISCDNELPH
ncbi:MAG: Calx-beta domain-containing protein [Pseudomonadota bacterium]